MTIAIRERPPLRTYILADTPSGRQYKWSKDDPNPDNNFSGLSWSDSMPGGFEAMDCTLPRKSNVSYPDMERFTTLTVKGAGSETLGEYRLERAPATSGSQVSISPSATGWIAHLEDDRTVSIIFIDTDLSRWTAPPSARILGLIGFSAPNQNAPQTAWDSVNNLPSLVMQVTGTWASPTTPRCETWYDAGAGNTIAMVGGSFAGGNPDLAWNLTDSLVLDTAATVNEASGDWYTAQRGNFGHFFTARYRYVRLAWFYGATPAGTDGGVYVVNIQNLRIIGSSGIPAATADSIGATGYLATEIMKYVLSTWCSSVSFTDQSISPSSFSIPQAAYTEKTTAAAILADVNSYELNDYGVWDNREFSMYPRGTRGRAWKARVAPSNLKETGPQIDLVWNGIAVAYQDTDGTTRTVGPIGSGCDTESAQLIDSDPENPANKLGVRKWDMLVLGRVSTLQGAINTGAVFLQQAKLLDSSGQATFNGWIEDSNGILYPYHAARSGDTVQFVDASDNSPRRIVRTGKNDETHSCDVDLDSPPQGLDTVLAQLNVTFAARGL